MLPLRLVKTPHKILSMNLTIKFKQFLSREGLFSAGVRVGQEPGENKNSRFGICYFIGFNVLV